MSDLNNFHNSEAWRTRLKNLLFMDRALQPTEVKETQRHSLDFSSDFQEILEEKRIPRRLNEAGNDIEAASTMFRGTNDDKENVGEFNETLTSHSSQKNRRYQREMFAAENQTMNVTGLSDESFEVIEKMCDKTVSDPNSTLFHYMQRRERKAQAQLASVRERSTGANFEDDPEAAALQRLLNELHTEEQPVNESLLKGVDVDGDLTLLDDVEAPSRLWENTVTGETMLQTSPVKMVGLLRPSTILEECAEETTCSDTSSNATYDSALRGACSSEATTSCYETAHESVVSEIVAFQTHCSATANQVNCGATAAAISSPEANLIDLDCTIAATSAQNVTAEVQREAEEDSDESVIEVLSDDEQEQATTAERPTSSELPRTSGSTYSDSGCSNSASSRRCSSVAESEEPSAAETSVSDKLPDFNDTMEEVDYILQMGLQQLKSRAEAECVKSSWSAQTRATPQTVNPVQVVGMQINPYPKLNVFAKPSAIPTSASMRFKSGSGNNAFAHIRSPIGLYINRTGKTPLMASMKSNSKSADVHNSSTFRGVELESRLLQPQFKDTVGRFKDGAPATHSPRTLPKKAYISSEFKHVVDERTPLTVPGGQSIQKYIGPAMLPSVLRHEGKVKRDEVAGVTPLPQTPHSEVTGRRTDLGDLSVMSGDVSVYTIRDAQKL